MKNKDTRERTKDSKEKQNKIKTMYRNYRRK